MKNFEGLLIGKTCELGIFGSDKYVKLSDCLDVLRKAYEDGFSDGLLSINESDNKTEYSQSGELVKQFEAFRKAYKGTKRGLNTEYYNLRKKHKDYKEIVPMLLPLYEIQEARRTAMKERGDWIPQLPNMQTYINQRRWEEEINTSSVTDSKHFDEDKFGVKVYTMNGKKFYGNGIEIPMEAPKRPSQQHAYSKATNSWYID